MPQSTSLPVDALLHAAAVLKAELPSETLKEATQNVSAGGSNYAHSTENEKGALTDGSSGGEGEPGEKPSSARSVGNPLLSCNQNGYKNYLSRDDYYSRAGTHRHMLFPPSQYENDTKNGGLKVEPAQALGKSVPKIDMFKLSTPPNGLPKPGVFSGPSESDTLILEKFLRAQGSSVEILDQLHTLRQERAALEVPPRGGTLMESQVVMQTCTSCHRKLGPHHFSGKATCDACLTRKRNKRKQDQNQDSAVNRVLIANLEGDKGRAYTLAPGKPLVAASNAKRAKIKQTQVATGEFSGRLPGLMPIWPGKTPQLPNPQIHSAAAIALANKIGLSLGSREASEASKARNPSVFAAPGVNFILPSEAGGIPVAVLENLFRQPHAKLVQPLPQAVQPPQQRGSFEQLYSVTAELLAANVRPGSAFGARAKPSSK